MSDLSTITCIEDLHRVYQRRVPRMFYDYCDSGSWTESTYRANEDDFQKIKLRQRVAVNMTGRTTRTTMVGQDVAMPVALAPTGLTGMQHADGEILAARAARDFGVPFTLSTMSICSIEDVAEHAGAGLLVPAVRDARPRLHRAPDRPRQGGRLLGAAAHARSADAGPAPQRHQERPVVAPKPTLCQPHQPGDQAALVPRHAGHPPPQLRQHRRPCQGRGRHVVAGVVDGRAVRPRPQLGRRGVDQEALGRQADHQGHHGRRRRPPGCQQWGRRAHRQQPRWPPARRRAVVHCRAARHRAGRGQRHRGVDGRRHPQRPGRAQGPRPGCAGHHDRPCLPLRPGRLRRAGRDAGAGDHPQGAGSDHGVLRSHRHQHRGREHPAAGHLPAA